MVHSSVFVEIDMCRDGNGDKFRMAFRRYIFRQSNKYPQLVLC